MNGRRQQPHGRNYIGIVRAGYDAASRSPEAMRHWRGADMLSADSALAPDIRKLVISRSRYEVANNGYAQGIISTLADDAIGTGPRLQYYLVGDGRDNPADRRTLQRRELRWQKWAKAAKLRRMLTIARMAKAQDGEVFIQKTHNPKLKSHVKIDLAVFESEQVGSPLTTGVRDYHRTGVPKEVDGILYDKHGNPTKYRFWTVHPGSNGMLGVKEESYTVDADNVIHYANLSRPGQHRGLPEIASTLNIFNDLRRFSNAVIAAAETAAEISFVLSTDTPPDDDDVNGGQAKEEERRDRLRFLDVVELCRNAGIALPEGWKANQMKAEQPTSTYDSFFDSKLNEAARPLSMPFNVAKGNSAGYNYASGRLDRQTYDKKIRNERCDIEETILDDLHETFEAMDQLFYPEDYKLDSEVTHGWMWDGSGHVDPVKEATAQEKRLNSTSTLAEECAREGKDWELVLEQRALERKKKIELGLPTESSGQPNTPQGKDEDDDEKDE